MSRLWLEETDWKQLRKEHDLPKGFVEAFEDRVEEDRQDAFFFEANREILLISPDAETLRKLSSVAHVEASSGETYKFQVRDMDVWNSSKSLDEMKEVFLDIIGEERPNFFEWLERTYERQHVFTIEKENTYYVLKASSAERLQYAKEIDQVADNLVMDLSDTKARIDFGSKSRAAIKKALLKKGYPVQADYAFKEVEESIGAELNCDLRPYQQDMLEEAWRRKACVLANPSGSGKTVTAIGMICKADSPTLVLVPQRSLIPQWKEELLDKTSLDESQIGEFHGDTKEMRDVTLATYHIASSKTELFRKEWGLIIFDEVHHIPSDVFRKTADIQSTRRLGLSASPVREDSREREIFALIGPEIGGDWSFFFERGHVLRPEVTMHFVDWASEGYRKRYENAEGIQKHIIASQNPAKHGKLEQLLEEYDDSKVIVFCDWLDQAEELAEKFDIPYLTGETPHEERNEVMDRFRGGELSRLIISRIGDEGLDIPDADATIVMSGQGGSRRQATQRAGRVMRPQGDAKVHFVATKGSNEEDFVRRQMDLMKEKGIQITVDD
ncbi:MAG: DEAD/DEAH box helicase [Candidatus Nanohaloarchaea archaeon]|nr:DEAD/DEAH box helicase [Candidatus Nanohaloarchaea archaeon]